MTTLIHREEQRGILTRVGIHQPNFFPWIGFFSKAIVSDSFVILDDAQITDRKGSWSNRSMFAIGAIPKWVTAPIDKSTQKERQIREVRFQDTDWRRDLIRKVEPNYAKAPFFKSEWAFWKEIVLFQSNSLVEYNMNAIEQFFTRFNLPTSKIVYSSSLEISTTGTQRLVDICQSLNGTEYIYGGGALNYQENAMFENEGIRLRPLNYRQPEPLLLEGHPEGLSFLDSIFRCGPEYITQLLELEITRNS